MLFLYGRMIGTLPINKVESYLILFPFIKGGQTSISMFGRSSDPILFSSNFNSSFDTHLGSPPIPYAEAYDITFVYAAFHFTQPLAVIMA